MMKMNVRLTVSAKAGRDSDPGTNMRLIGAVLVTVGLLTCGAAYADDDSALVTGRSVAVTDGGCDRVTPVCASMGGNRLVPYDNECHARADGASSVSFSGCFDEN